jgi:dTDP-4-dehydrorhamnose reductase
MKPKILILGVSGMLGNALLKFFCSKKNFSIFGTIKSSNSLAFSSSLDNYKLFTDVDVEKKDILLRVFSEVVPDIVINCVGVVKQSKEMTDTLMVISLNSLLPHYLAKLSAKYFARFIHISTDCVFSGRKGNYTENDFADSHDVYGRSKLLGEIDYPNTITLRTSTIGHELNSKYGLLDWFLSQQTKCNGYACAIFSGLPAVIFAQIIRDIVIPHSELTGLYHVSAKPINKFDLLKLIADVYDKKINIDRDERLIIDRSLDSTRFRLATGYVAPEWTELIRRMHSYK